MKCNLGFVAMLAVMPLFILFAGLAAAADALGSPVVWGVLAAILAAGGAAGRLAAREDIDQPGTTNPPLTDSSSSR
jgi:hypothetical protein